jgi:hypothetical protein
LDSSNRSPQPTVTDVIEGLAAALAVAVELAEPQRTAARCLTIQTRMQVAADGSITPDELLGCLRWLVADWRAS